MSVRSIILDVHEVEKKVKDKTLIHPLSFQLEKGNILALCGGNGAGKSTLIRLIVGLIKATNGKITINGVERSKNKQQYANQIGYMPDDFIFQSSITAKETISFYAELKRVDEKRVNELLDLVGLINEQDKTIATFSKGMKQRMLLAQALLTAAPLLILDEPTNGLDPYWIQVLSDLLVEAKKRGQTVLFSTHDLHVAESIADEVIFLSDGKVVSEGNIELYQQIGLYQSFQELYVNVERSS